MKQAHRYAEDSLRDSEAQLRAVGDNLPDSVIYQLLREKDGSVRFTYVSAGTERITGIRVQDALRDPATLIGQISPEYRERYLQAKERSLQEMSDIDLELPFRRADGQQRWMRLHARPRRLPDGRLVWDGVQTDITERRKTDAVMQALEAESRKLHGFHIARQTVAAIAHELNQPLGALLSYAEAARRMMLSGHPDPEKLKRAIDGSADQAMRAGQVVHELMAFLNDGEVAMEAIDVNQTVTSVLDRIARDGYEDIVFRKELANHLPPIAANRLQVEKVLANLIHNGVDAMRDGDVEAKSLVVSVREGKDSGLAQITVADCGPGIDPKTRPHVFDPFFTTKPRGLGMGLAVCRAIIKAHGGDLWVESEAGRGTAFHFTLAFA